MCSRLSCLVWGLTLLGGLVALGGLAPARAEIYSHRQYYGAWHKHASGYSYRPYYYKPTPSYVGYKHHYVIYQPQRSQHYYFYNPAAKKFWGRCPISSGGQPAYSLLAEPDRQATLATIPETAFPTPGALPAIPESNDGAKLDLPPDDLPAVTSLPPQ